MALKARGAVGSRLRGVILLPRGGKVRSRLDRRQAIRGIVAGKAGLRGLSPLGFLALVALVANFLKRLIERRLHKGRGGREAVAFFNEVVAGGAFHLIGRKNCLNVHLVVELNDNGIGAPRARGQRRREDKYNNESN
jgi:hypothetical protein